MTDTTNAAPPRNKGGRPRTRPQPGPVTPPRAGTALSSDDIAAIAIQVAAVMAKMQGEPPRRVVPPPRVGAPRSQPDDDENYDPLDTRVQRAAREKLFAADVPRSEGMTDEEVLAMFQSQELGEFDVPDELIPPGMAVGWWTKSVIGREDPSKQAELARNGWVAVKHEDMPGCYGMKGETGPIFVKGLQLMMRPVEMHALRQRYIRLLAKQAVRDKVAQLSSAPPGTGPRTHEKVRPVVKRTYEQLPVE